VTLKRRKGGLGKENNVSLTVVVSEAHGLAARVYGSGGTQRIENRNVTVLENVRTI